MNDGIVVLGCCWRPQRRYVESDEFMESLEYTTITHSTLPCTLVKYRKFQRKQPNNILHAIIVIVSFSYNNIARKRFHVHI